MLSAEDSKTRDATPDFPNSKAFCHIELRTRLQKTPAKDAQHAEFLAYMSHELRTPLTAILGFTQVIKMAKDAPELGLKPEEYIDHIDVSAQQLMKVIEAMLGYLEAVCEIEAARQTQDESAHLKTEKRLPT
ncbi:histidine kinase dimerization/phospho-acceptor domain-containing protein [Magnetovibrio blakemorei]|uniref:histidine kinase dimerization/phospho-acceptor domain-containing protein n=1 Tax=Magnetovibrio blakemorei TaxID=28181 RepID=UPI000A075079|nr:histidine kinase dimerization/phospho-acceptor domain-containing protein [Magnetovibrio blakemorei]